jgi:hypothetical protein
MEGRVFVTRARGEGKPARQPQLNPRFLDLEQAVGVANRVGKAL